MNFNMKMQTYKKVRCHVDILIWLINFWSSFLARYKVWSTVLLYQHKSPWNCRTGLCQNSSCLCCITLLLINFIHQCSYVNRTENTRAHIKCVQFALGKYKKSKQSTLSTPVMTYLMIILQLCTQLIWYRYSWNPVRFAPNLSFFIGAS